MSLIEEKQFKNIKTLEVANYEYCTFIGCDFASADLSRISFMECIFENCDLSLATIADTSFKDVTFVECKMLGLHFDYCNQFLFEIHCENSLLNLSSFYKVSAKRSTFLNCQLQEIDFAEADFSGVKFDNCNLSKSIFDRTNIEKTDFSTAQNYSIDLRKNRFKKAKFSKDGIIGLLNCFDIAIQ